MTECAIELCAQPFGKLFGSSDDLRAYRALFFGEFFLGSLLLPRGDGGPRGCANQDAVLIGIIRGGQSFPCDAGPRESMDSKHVKYILGQVLASVPYCTDWSFFF